MNLESVRQCGLQSKPEKGKGTGLIVSGSTHAQPSPLSFKAFVSESRLVLAYSPCVVMVTDIIMHSTFYS